MSVRLRLGTRASPLARIQTDEVCRRLAAAHPALAEPGALEVVPIRTTGDRERTRPLAEIGGKGLFTKELEEALATGAIDLAVHSMKDVESVLPAGLAIACLLPREDPRDAFFARRGGGLADLPEGALVGTSSPRRQAQLLARRPDLRVVPFRGNVETRLRKLADGEVDATLLAVAGLRRLGLADRIPVVLEPADMLPAVAQGAIGVEIRADDDRARDWLTALHDDATERAVAAERAMLAALEGSCRTPIAGLAVLTKGGLALDGLVAMPDGSRLARVRREAPEPEALGRAVAAALLDALGPGSEAAWRAG